MEKKAKKTKKWQKKQTKAKKSCIQEFFYIICLLNHDKFCIIEIHIRKSRGFYEFCFLLDFLLMEILHKSGVSQKQKERGMSFEVPVLFI